MNCWSKVAVALLVIGVLASGAITYAQETRKAGTGIAASSPTLCDWVGARARDGIQALMQWRRPKHPPLAGEPSLDSANAGLRYLWLFARMDRELAARAGWVLSRAPLEMDANEEGYTTEGLRKLLDENEAWIASVVEATRLETCDVRFSADPRAILRPGDARRGWLGGTRRAKDILIADAYRCWTDGDSAGAADRCAAVIRLAAHVRDATPTLIGRMIAGSILNPGCEAIRDHAWRMRPEERAMLMRELHRMNIEDPMRLHEAWSHSRVAMTAFVERNLRGEAVGFDLQYELATMQAVERAIGRTFERFFRTGEVKLNAADVREAIEDAGETAGDATADELRATLQRAGGLGSRVEAGWGKKDDASRAAFADTEAAIEADRTGVLGLILAVARRTEKQVVKDRLAIKGAIEALENPVAPVDEPGGAGR